MERKSRRIDPEFDELVDRDMPFDNIGRDMEIFRVFGVHGDPVHQLVVVGEMLGVELLLKTACHGCD